MTACSANLFGVVFTNLLVNRGGMNALDRAIKIAGSQSELARRMRGKIKTGHIYYWRKHGFVPPDQAPSIERATGKLVRCEELCPRVKWFRDSNGNVTGYRVAVDDRPDLEAA